MEYNFKDDVKLFMVFDILGDTERTGPHLWQVDRFRLEDVKNHVLDLLLLVRILKKYLPDNLDYNKLSDYILCHDLPEAITGDITKFEGVSDDEIRRVTDLAISYLEERFNGSMNIGQIIRDYEGRVDLESKIVKMLDSLHSSTTFIKYESERHIDTENPNIIPELRQMPFVSERIEAGYDVADIFFEFHMNKISFSEDEREKYGISNDDANKIANAIRGFGYEIYSQKVNGTLSDVKKDFPAKAMIYNRNSNNGS